MKAWLFNKGEGGGRRLVDGHTSYWPDHGAELLLAIALVVVVVVVVEVMVMLMDVLVNKFIFRVLMEKVDHVVVVIIWWSGIGEGELKVMGINWLCRRRRRAHGVIVGMIQSSLPVA